MTDDAANPHLADLIEQKRRFIALTEHQAEFAATLPSSSAIVSGEATLTDEQRAEWDRIQRELGGLAAQISAHPAFEGLSQVERFKLDEEASKAARSS